MGDKTEARRLMAARRRADGAGQPGPVATSAAPRRSRRGSAIPVMLKAAGGGGGIGMARVDGRPTWPPPSPPPRGGPRRRSATPRSIVERYLERPRHVEVQVFADAHGAVVHLHERECSIQRRHQKLDRGVAGAWPGAGSERGSPRRPWRAPRAVGYVNAGTIEFLVDAAGDFYFLEMNTRLQVEHPVTEEVTGIDLVATQLRVAAGERLPLAAGGDRPARRGHRVPGLRRGPGQELPAVARERSRGSSCRTGEGIRVESGMETGSIVSVHYDPLLFKLVARGAIATGADRACWPRAGR